jgi:hypothetical protein
MISNFALQTPSFLLVILKVFRTPEFRKYEGWNQKPRFHTQYRLIRFRVSVVSRMHVFASQFLDLGT